MLYKMIDYYLDCPYKAFSLQAGREMHESLVQIFHSSAEDSIKHLFINKQNMTNKVKSNAAVNHFEILIKSKDITGVNFDLFMRKFILNCRLLRASARYEIQDTYSNINFSVPVMNIDRIDLPIAGYHHIVEGAYLVNSYKFYMYLPNVTELHLQSLILLKLLHQGISTDSSINKDMLKRSQIVVFDFYNGGIKKLSFNKLNSLMNRQHIEAITTAIKLGLSYPSPKDYHCRKCEFKMSCPHSCDKTEREQTAEIEDINSKYLNAIRRADY